MVGRSNTWHFCWRCALVVFVATQWSAEWRSQELRLLAGTDGNGGRWDGLRRSTTWCPQFEEISMATNATNNATHMDLAWFSCRCLISKHFAMVWSSSWGCCLARPEKLCAPSCSLEMLMLRHLSHLKLSSFEMIAVKVVFRPGVVSNTPRE